MSTTQLRDANGETAPERFLIAHDDYHARYVGRTADGRQFFVTTPFVWTSASEGGGEFAARYLFDDDGLLLDATIVPLGHRPGDGSLPGNVSAFPGQQSAVEVLLDEIGPVTLADITIAPFRLTRDGVEFGMSSTAPTRTTMTMMSGIGTSPSSPATSWLSTAHGIAASTTPDPDDLTLPVCQGGA